jgi:hypothetical protein
MPDLRADWRCDSYGVGLRFFCADICLAEDAIAVDVAADRGRLG